MVEVDVEKLIEQLAQALVDRPDQVAVSAVEGTESTVFELKVASSDVGKVIGKQGRIANALRVIIGALGAKAKRRYSLEILESRGDTK